MPADEQATNKNQWRGKWNSYNTTEEFLEAINLKKGVEEYHDTPFYSK